jgi:hypothetical protein
VESFQKEPPPQGRVSFPLAGAPVLTWVKKCHRNWVHCLKSSQLAPHREHYRRVFSSSIIRAYEQVSYDRPTGPVSDLREPLRLIVEALRVLMRSKNYDDAHPIRESELSPALVTQINKSPAAIWLNVKLAYTHLCLLLMVRILWHVLPEFVDSWNEYEKMLKMDHWRLQFILDSDTSKRKSTPAHPTLSDVLRIANRDTDVTSASPTSATDV